MKRLLEILSWQRPHGSAAEQLVIEKVLLKPYPEMFVIGPKDCPNFAIEVGTPNVTRTLFSCHIDTVHNKGGYVPPRYDKDLEIIQAPKGDVLGADNGAGIWLLLSMIDAGIPGFYVFHRGEERGGIGSKWIATNESKMLRTFDRAIAFDRRDNISVITHQGGRRCCSDTFAAALAAQLSLQHAPDPTGSFTDTAHYVDCIPECTNVSVGYQNEHSTSEYLDVEYLLWLSECVKQIQWEALPTSRDPSKVEYDKKNLFWLGAGIGADEDVSDYSEVLEYVENEPYAAAEILWALLEQNGMTLREAEREFVSYVDVPAAESLGAAELSALDR
jgi:hypothetical protein